jgi:hypothetical protein
MTGVEAFTSTSMADSTARASGRPLVFAIVARCVSLTEHSSIAIVSHSRVRKENSGRSKRWILERIPFRFEHSLHGERNSCIPAG